MRKKSYEFSSTGYALFVQDCKNRKEKKVSFVTSLVILGGCLAFGVISKPILVIYLLNLIATTAIELVL